MKRLILPVLISVAIHPISTCAQESNTNDEAATSGSSATAYLQLTADKPEVSKKAWEISPQLDVDFVDGDQVLVLGVTFGKGF